MALHGKSLKTPELDGYQYVHCNSKTLAGIVGIYVKNSIFLNMKPNISTELPTVENLGIEIEINNKNNCRRCLSPSCSNRRSY